MKGESVVGEKANFVDKILFLFLQPCLLRGKFEDGRIIRDNANSFSLSHFFSE